MLKCNNNVLKRKNYEKFLGVKIIVTHFITPKDFLSGKTPYLVLSRMHSNHNYHYSTAGINCQFTLFVSYYVELKE